MRYISVVICKDNQLLGVTQHLIPPSGLEIPAKYLRLGTGKVGPTDVRYVDIWHNDGSGTVGTRR